MKKLFALILTFCVMAATLSFMALATDAPASDVVLRVSGEKSDGNIAVIRDYKDFADGWNAAMRLAESGEDLKKNDFVRVVVDLYADWTSADGFWSSVYFPEGVRVTLNLNGHTVDRGLDDWQYDGEVLYIDEKANVIINNGTVTGGFNYGGAGGIHIHDDAIVILNNVNVVGNTVVDDKGTAIAVYDGATLTMNGGCLSDNLLNAYYSAFAWTEGTLYVDDATAILNNVVIAGNQFNDHGSEGAAVSLNGLSTVTLNACTVENNGNKEGTKANSIFFTDDRDCVLNLNNTVIKNNGVAFSSESGMPSALFEIHGKLTMSGCTVTGNVPAAMFRVWGNCAAVDVDINDSTFTDNASAVFAYPGDMESYGCAQYTLVNCQFSNKGMEKDYVFKGDSLADVSLIDCDLGTAAIENKERVKIVDSSRATGSMLGEGSLPMVVALAALAVSIASLGVVMASNKKKVSDK